MEEYRENTEFIQKIPSNKENILEFSQLELNNLKGLIPTSVQPKVISDSEKGGEIFFQMGFLLTIQIRECI